MQVNVLTSFRFLSLAPSSFLCNLQRLRALGFRVFGKAHPENRTPTCGGRVVIVHYDMHSSYTTKILRGFCNQELCLHLSQFSRP